MTALNSFQQLCEKRKPIILVVLGSGLGGLVRRLLEPVSITFSAIPDLPAATIAGHHGRLTLGSWDDIPVLFCEGRLHFYEGHPWSVVTRLVNLAADLGVKAALFTNAAGGIRTHLGPGSLMAIRDHICWLDRDPWKQPGPGGLGGARPSPYDPGMLSILVEAAGAVKIELPTGVYASLTGPCYETPAEIQALRFWGADSVGMSTAREVEAGTSRGLRCAGISCITNAAAGLGPPLNHHDVLETAQAQASKLELLLGTALPRMALSSSLAL